MSKSEQAASLAAVSGLLHNLSVQDVLYMNSSVCFVLSWTSAKLQVSAKTTLLSSLPDLSVSVRVLRVQLSLLHSVQCITKDKHKNCRQHLYIMQHFRCVNICHWCQ